MANQVGNEKVSVNLTVTKATLDVLDKLAERLEDLPMSRGEVVDYLADGIRRDLESAMAMEALAEVTKNLKNGDSVTGMFTAADALLEMWEKDISSAQ